MAALNKKSVDDINVKGKAYRGSGRNKGCYGLL